MLPPSSRPPANVRTLRSSPRAAPLTPSARPVEFYFADSNLPYDRFMWTLHTANAEHWVPLATVASFKRMREHAVRGLEWVAAALRARSDALEVDPTGTRVRRRTEVEEPRNQFERSVYAVRAASSARRAGGMGADQRGPGRCRKGLGRSSLGCSKSSKSTLSSLAGRTRCACAGPRTSSSRFAFSLGSPLQAILTHIRTGLRLRRVRGLLYC